MIPSQVEHRQRTPSKSSNNHPRKIPTFGPPHPHPAATNKQRHKSLDISADGERIGKCPADFPAGRRQILLDRAVPHIVSAPYSEAFPKRLYVVDQDGTVYTAQTSNPGDSYHGYPYAGPLGKRLIAALRDMARTENCETAFNKWLKRYVTIGGSPDL